MTFKNKFNLALVLLFLFVVSLTVFLIWPAFSEIKNTSKEIMEKREKIVVSEIKVQKARDFRSFYQKREESFQRLDTFFVNSEAPIDFINFLEKTSQDSGVSLEISAGSLVENPQELWPFLNFQISSAGLSSDFLKFLEKLESSPYLAEIQNLNIRRLSESEISANFSIKVYAQ